MKRKDDGKLHFNIIDFLIIFIVLGCIVGVVVRYNIIDRMVLDTKRDEVSISFLASGITPQIANTIDKANGEEFFVVGSSESIGTLELTPDSIKNASIVEADDNGNPVKSSDDTLRDVRGVFKAYGNIRDDGFFLGGTLFAAPGKTLTVESRSVRFSVIITEIKHG